MGPGFESLRAHHKISLTNAVSLRNFSATRSLVRSVAFLLPHKSKNSHTKPCAKCGFFVTTRKQKFPHEALCEVWLFCYHTKAKIPTRSPVRSVAFIYTIGCMCINSCTYSRLSTSICTIICYFKLPRCIIICAWFYITIIHRCCPHRC